MTSTGQTDQHTNIAAGISRLAPMQPAAFSNTWGSDYGERYAVTEVEGCSCHHGRSRSFHGTHEWTTASGYPPQQQQQQQQQQPPPCAGASSSSIWQQHAALGSDVIKYHHHHHHHHNQSPTEDLRFGGSRHGSSSRGGPTGMFGCSPESMSRDSPASLPNSSSELYDTTNTVRGWQQFVDPGVRYPTLLPPPPSSPSATSPLQQLQLGNAHADSMSEGAIIRELIGRLGGSSMGSNNGDNCNSLTSACPSQHSAGGGVEDLSITVGKLGGSVGAGGGGGSHSSCSWNNSANLTVAAAEITQGNVGCSFTVDPSKGALSLNGVGGAASGLRTSHNCLRVSPFTADPGFAERAARFSSFGNHSGSYAQSFSPAGPGECGGATRMRSRSSSGTLSQQTSSKHLTGAASGCPTTRESAGCSALNTGTNPGSDGLESVIHSGEGGPPSYDMDLRATATAAASGDDHDDYHSPDGSYHGRVREKPRVKGLSSTGSKILARPHDNGGAEEQGEFREARKEAGGQVAGPDGTMPSPSPADHASPNPGRTRKSSSSHEQASPAGHREPCPSPCGSGATDVSANKRKITSAERHPTKDVGSGASSHCEKDTKRAEIKRFRREEGSKEKVETRSKPERSSSETSGETSPRSAKEQSKPLEPPKPDYIHVRARRGQATDSHSLAERVRREKISERMKFLQDLVPGCNKVTGKAVMLDEIINYVQSLQRQVEFLSMKLASVNPRLDVNLENLLAKENLHSTLQSFGPVPEAIRGIPYPPLHSQLQQGLDYQPHSEASLLRDMRLGPAPVAIPLHTDAMQDDDVRQTSVWDDGELQSIVQMGHGRLTSSSALALH